MMMRLALPLLLVVAATASEPAPASASSSPACVSPPVARIDGAAITLRQLEDALLKREGAELVEDLVHGQLEKADWAAMGDDDIVLEIAGMRLKRGLLAAQLLRQKAAAVREELINIAIVEAAMRKEQVVIGEAETQAEIARMQRKLDQSLAERANGAKMSFEDYVKQTQKMPLADFIRQPGFRMAAGLHQLAERRLRVEATDDMVQAWFDQHRADYDQAEGVDLSLISLPYQEEQVGPGAKVVTEAERQRLLEVVTNLRQTIAQGSSFARCWQFWGRAYDPQGAPDGHLGWIGHDGARAQKGAPAVPKAVVEAAFAADAAFPILLPAVPHDTGVAIALVHGRRAAKPAVFAEVRARVLDDLIGQALEGRTQRLLGELREAAAVDYESLPALIDARAAATGMDAAAAVGRTTSP